MAETTGQASAQPSGKGWHGDPAGHAKAGRKGGQRSSGNFRNDPKRAAEAGKKGGSMSPGNFKNNPERAKTAGRKGGSTGSYSVYAWYMERMGRRGDPYDPDASVKAQYRYMINLYGVMKNRFPTYNKDRLIRLTLAGYNAGPNNKAVKDGRVPKNGETDKYVSRIMRRVAELEGKEVRTSSGNKPNSLCPDVTIMLGYYDTNTGKQMLCALPNLPSTGETSDPGSKHYIKVSRSQ